MNATSRRLLEVLADGVADAIRIDAGELAESVDLDEGQVVTWLASARVGAAQVHIFFCEADGEDEEFVSARHAEGGMLVAAEGPFHSFVEAKWMAGPAPQGWVNA